MYTAIRFAASSTDEQRNRLRVAPRVFSLDTKDGELLVRRVQRKLNDTGNVVERVNGSLNRAAA
jgi:hypothetical protein